MTPPAAEQERRPVARLRLRKAAVAVPRDRAPVFHIFEELFARSGGASEGGQEKGDRA